MAGPGAYLPLGRALADAAQARALAAAVARAGKRGVAGAVVARVASRARARAALARPCRERPQNITEHESYEKHVNHHAPVRATALTPLLLQTFPPGAGQDIELQLQNASWTKPGLQLQVPHAQAPLPLQFWPLTTCGAKGALAETPHARSGTEWRRARAPFRLSGGGGG